MKLRSDFRAAVLMKNLFHRESREQVKGRLHQDQQRRIRQGQEFFSEVDQHTGWEQVPGGGTHPNGVGSELTFFINCADLSIWLQLVSFTVDVNPL